MSTGSWIAICHLTPGLKPSGALVAEAEVAILEPPVAAREVVLVVVDFLVTDEVLPLVVDDFLVELEVLSLVADLLVPTEAGLVVDCLVVYEEVGTVTLEEVDDRRDVVVVMRVEEEEEEEGICLAVLHRVKERSNTVAWRMDGILIPWRRMINFQNINKWNKWGLAD